MEKLIAGVLCTVGDMKRFLGTVMDTAYGDDTQVCFYLMEPQGEADTLLVMDELLSDKRSMCVFLKRPQS